MSRTCADCGKPLGGTKEKCHECGGESKRADDAGTFRDGGGLAHWFKRIVGGER